MGIEDSRHTSNAAARSSLQGYSPVASPAIGSDPQPFAFSENSAASAWEGLERRPGLALQMRRSGDQGATSSPADVHAHASEGIRDSGHALPHLEAIQSAFGSHDVTGVRAHTGGEAQAAAGAIGASAFALGNHVAFGGAPDLHTAAHEAAHVVQQRAGVSLKGGIGQAGDAYEQHADAVADAVVLGKSAEALLGKGAAPAGSSSPAVQRVELDAASVASDTAASASATVGGPEERKKENPQLKREANDKGHSGPLKDDGKTVDAVKASTDFHASTDEQQLQTEQFKLFSKRMETLVTTLGLKEDPQALARDVWLKGAHAIKATDKEYDTVGSKQALVGRNEDGTDRISKRTDLESKVFQDLLPKFSALTEKLKGFAKIQGMKAKTWGFWSTAAAKELALKHCDMSLEGGAVGFLFDGLNITGDWDMQLWAALSRAYAEAVVDTVEERQIECFIGPFIGDMTIYDKIERPVIDAGMKVNPKLKRRFHAVATKDLAAREADHGVKRGEFTGTAATCDKREEAVKAANSHAEVTHLKKTPAAESASATAPA